MLLNFEGLEMQKRNIPMGRVQRLPEKNWVICLVILFTSKVIVIEISKIVHFFVFFDDGSKCLSASERSHLALSKNGIVSRLWGYRSRGIEGRNIKVNSAQ